MQISVRYLLRWARETRRLLRVGSGIVGGTLFAGALASVLSCNGIAPDKLAVPVGRAMITLTPILHVGQTTAATAVFRDASGSTLSVTSWSSSNPAVATVSQAGIVTGVAAGNADISATAGDMTANATVTVTPVPVGKVVVSIAASTLRIGQTAQATATLLDTAGNVLSDTSGRITAWSSSNQNLATVSSTGLVRAVGSGTVTVTATSGGQSGQATISIASLPLKSVAVAVGASQLRIGQTTQATATLRDSSNNVVTGPTIIWSSSDSTIAAVSTTGVVRAVSAGVATIAAVSEGVVGSAGLSVVAAASAVGVSIATTTLQVGGTTTATATVRDGAGNILTGRTVTWSSTAAGVATVVSSGATTATVTAVAGGSANIVATADSVSGSASVIVTSSGGMTATSLSITTQPSTSSPSGASFSQQPVIQLRDASNNAVAQAGVLVTAAIASGSGTIGGALTATTNSSGAATFSNLSITGVGTATLSFTASGLTAATSSQITITDPQAPTISITSPTTTGSYSTTASTLTVGGTASDNVGVTQVTWVNSRGGSGTATGTTSWSASSIALQSGSNIITVTAHDAAGNTATASLTVTVGAASATQLAITTQPSATAPSGVSFAQQPVIQLRDASNNAVAQAGVVVTAAIASGSGTIGGALTATTNSSGAATFSNLSITGVGTATLSFTASGLTAATSSQITITDPQAPTISITSPTTTGSYSTTASTLTVGGTASDNVGVTQVTWVSSRGGSGTATGTTSWSASSIALQSGSNVITVTAHDAAGNTATASLTVTVGAAPATQLTITTQPSATAPSGVSFTQQPVIQLRDASNNAVAQAGVVVTAAISTGTGILGGTLTSTTNSSGMATFANLSIAGIGTYTLIFSATCCSAVTSSAIVTTDTQAPTISITSPTAAGTYSTTASTVTLGGTASDNVGVTQVTWANNRGGSGTASGTTSWTASNIALQSGSNVITATARDAAGNTATASLTVTVTAGPATHLTITTQPSSTGLLGVVLGQQPVIQLRDASNNAVSQSGVVVTAAVATGLGILAGTMTATTNGSGVATFTNLSIIGTVGALTLSFSAPSLTGVTSGTVTVSSSSTTACANEPAGFTRFNDQPWDQVPTTNPAQSTGWIDEDGRAASRLSIISDSTSPFPWTNHNVVAGLFQQGDPGGSGPFYVIRPFSSTEQFKTLYFCVYMKHSANFDNTNGNAGTKFLWPAGDQIAGTQTYVTFDGPYMNVGINQQGGASREMYSNLGDTANASMYGRRGTWVVYEFLLKANTSNSSANGQMDIWINGVHTHHYTDVSWQMGSSRTWQSLAWNPTYGGGSNPVPHNQYEYIDHIRMSGSP